MKWEYLTERIDVTETDDQQLTKQLNQFGDDGWELIGAVQLVEEPFTKDDPDRLISGFVVFTFKRPASPHAGLTS